MKKELCIREEKINYIIKRSRRSRKLCLCVYPDGTLEARVPWWITSQEIERFILEKSRWVIEKLRLAKEREKNPIFARSSCEEYDKYKKQARALAKQKLKEFNQVYNFDYRKVAIRNQKTRWGSCSENGTLSYNYKIALLPEKYSDYIIVHELCHLGEFNHSERFWSLVSMTIPDYKTIRKELRKG